MHAVVLALLMLAGNSPADNSSGDMEASCPGGIAAGGACYPSNVALSFGDSGGVCGVWRLVSDGTDMSVSGAGKLMIASGGGTPPAPDGDVHIWTASAGTVTAPLASDQLVLENSDHAGLSILTPDNKCGYIYFGSPDAGDDDRGGIFYCHEAIGGGFDDTFGLVAGDATVYKITSAAIEGQQAFKLSTTAGDIGLEPAGNLTLTPTGETTTVTGDLVVTGTIIGGSYSSLWYHGETTAVTVTAQDTLYKITTFENVGEEDDDSNAVGDPVTDDDITIGASGAGTYEIGIQASMTVATAARHLKFFACVDLATPVTVTSSDDGTPVTLTIVAHGYRNGDVITITGATGDTNLNADHVVQEKTADTFKIADLDFTDINSGGVYNAGSGSIVRVCPGNIVIDRVVSNIQLGRGAAEAKYSLAASDTVSQYVANVESTDNPSLTQAVLKVRRVDD